MDNLRPGPVVKVGTTAIIPITRSDLYVHGRVAWAAVQPVAVVVIHDGHVSTLLTNGREERHCDWLKEVPGIAALVSEATG